MTITAPRHVYLIFSYVDPAIVPENKLRIALHCDIAATQEQKQAIICEHQEIGRTAESFLCKPDDAAIAEKIEWYAAEQAYHYQTLGGELAAIEIERGAQMTERLNDSKIRAELRAEYVDRIEQCVQVRRQPLRVVTWQTDGEDATRLATPKNDADAAKIRTAEIARRISEWDERMSELS